MDQPKKYKGGRVPGTDGGESLLRLSSVAPSGPLDGRDRRDGGKRGPCQVSFWNGLICPCRRIDAAMPVSPRRSIRIPLSCGICERCVCRD